MWHPRMAGDTLAFNTALGGTVRLRVGAGGKLMVKGAEDWDAFPLGALGVNLPRNWAFQGYQYAPSPMSETSINEIASGLPERGFIRAWANSLSDICVDAPADVTAGAGGKLVWAPKPGMDALVTSIQRANAAGLVWWMPLLDGGPTYDIGSTWSTRGDAEMHDFIAGWAAWMAARFTPAQVVLAPWNENRDTSAPNNLAIVNKANAAIREGAPNHWAALGTQQYSRDWSSDISGMAGVTTKARRFIDVHAYPPAPDATWVSGLAIKQDAATTAGMPFVYGELDPLTGGSADHPDTTTPARLTALSTIFTGLRDAGIVGGAWNDVGTTKRCFNFTSATSSVERSLTWIADVKTAITP